MWGVIIGTSSSRLIKDFVQKFRRAIQQGKHYLPQWFKCFPQGCCGDATAMLGSYLNDKGFGCFLFISGELFLNEDGVPQYKSHAWLKQKELIIDITASQFDAVLQDVIVTDNSEWHKKWIQKDLGIAKYKTRSNISASAYRKIAEIADAL